MPNSRQRVLEFIQSHRTVSVEEISQGMQMTSANARHHLAILLQQGLIEVIGEKPHRGRGRPTRLYRPSSLSIGDSTFHLAEALLSELGDSIEPTERAEWLRRVAARFAGIDSALDAPSTPRLHLTTRLNRAVQVLNERYYQARWEAHVQGPRLILGRCPFLKLLPRHPELCQMDAQLLETLTQERAELKARLAQDERGQPYCLFRLGGKQPNPEKKQPPSGKDDSIQ